MIDGPGKALFGRLKMAHGTNVRKPITVAELIKALEVYRPEQEVRFLTVAVDWIWDEGEGEEMPTLTGIHWKNGPDIREYVWEDSMGRVYLGEDQR